MTTINVSLPAKLKLQAEELVKTGFYVSFSDLVRHALRSVIEKDKYDLMTEETLKEVEQGKAVVLKTDKEVEEYFKNL